MVDTALVSIYPHSSINFILIITFVTVVFVIISYLVSFVRNAFVFVKSLDSLEHFLHVETIIEKKRGNYNQRGWLVKSWFKNLSRVTFLPFPSICYALRQFNLKPSQFTSIFSLVPLKCPLLITYLILSYSGIFILYFYSYYNMLIPKMHYLFLYGFFRIRNDNLLCPSACKSVR